MRTAQVLGDQPEHILAQMALWRVDDEPDAEALEVDSLPRLCNPYGTPHASVLGGLIDCAAAGAAVRESGSTAIAGADMLVRFLAPVRVGPFRAIAHVLRAGRTSIVVQVDVVDVGADRRPVATATMSFTRLDA